MSSLGGGNRNVNVGKGHKKHQGLHRGKAFAFRGGQKSAFGSKKEAKLGVRPLGWGFKFGIPK